MELLKKFYMADPADNAGQAAARLRTEAAEHLNK